MHAWVIGAGGLLGAALTEQFPDRFTSTAIPWSDSEAAKAVLQSELGRFRTSTSTEPWVVLWAAGSAIVSSSEAQAESELGVFTSFTRALAANHPAGRGCFFLASSAGGVYAGSANPPFDATTVPAPLSSYGRLKLAQEAVSREILGPVVPVTIGRIANLYGPGQDPLKPQGLIYNLCRAAVRKTPLNIYVPMDTVRDYTYVTDAAREIRAWAEWSQSSTIPSTTVAVIASGHGASVAELVNMVQRVSHRRIPVALGSDPSSPHQARDLRLVPTLRPGQRPAPLTPLATGVRRTFDAIISM